ncbi:MAG: hypothetical protein JO110_00580 [Acetobacteraceae bacterium]|nr:hypothetical protein [Acetobacteraceae bacterium]
MRSRFGPLMRVIEKMPPTIGADGLHRRGDILLKYGIPLNMAKEMTPEQRTVIAKAIVKAEANRVHTSTKALALLGSKQRGPGRTAAARAESRILVREEATSGLRVWPLAAFCQVPNAVAHMKALEIFFWHANGDFLVIIEHENRMTERREQAHDMTLDRLIHVLPSFTRGGSAECPALLPQANTLYSV